MTPSLGRLASMAILGKIDKGQAGSTGVRHAFGDRVLPERHPVEKTQGADELVEGWPGNPGRDEMNRKA